MADADAQKFSRLTLTAMVVGSMIGAGIFSLPARFGAARPASAPRPASSAPSSRGSLASGGMLMLAFVFQSLAVRKPEIDAGIFAYAKEGFRHYLGFAAAFGFCIGTCLGNTTYFVLIKSTLGAFFDWGMNINDRLSAFLFGFWEHNGTHEDIPYENAFGDPGRLMPDLDVYELGGGLTYALAQGWSLRPEVLYIRDEGDAEFSDYSSTEIWVNARKSF